MDFYKVGEEVSREDQTTHSRHAALVGRRLGQTWEHFRVNVADAALHDVLAAAHARMLVMAGQTETGHLAALRAGLCGVIAPQRVRRLLPAAL